MLVTFEDRLDSSWQQIAVGGGHVEVANGILRLAKQNRADNNHSVGYANAQIDDYQSLHRRDFLWRPPLTFTIRTRFSHEAMSTGDVAAQHLTGTAGFGFWNDPFMMTDARRPALPRALWFFYASPPSNMCLALDRPGYGWKAATIDAQTAPFLCLLPTAPFAIPLMHIRPIYRALWPIAQRAINVSEAMIQQPMSEWHTYRIEWRQRKARFFIDDKLILDCNTPPRGPLGLVIWIDNQYMVVTPRGQIRHGVVSVEKEERLEIEWIKIY